MIRPPFLRSFLCLVSALGFSSAWAAEESGELAPIEVGTVRYLPFDAGRLESNQVENVSPVLGAIHAEEEIGEIFARALQEGMRDLRTSDGRALVVDAHIDYVRSHRNGLAAHPINVLVLFEVRRNGGIFTSVPIEGERMQPSDLAIDEALFDVFHLICGRLAWHLQDDDPGAVEGAEDSASAEVEEGD